MQTLLHGNRGGIGAGCGKRESYSGSVRGQVTEAREYW